MIWVLFEVNIGRIGEKKIDWKDILEFEFLGFSNLIDLEGRKVVFKVILRIWF